jgi:hypothetical protein
LQKFSFEHFFVSLISRREEGPHARMEYTRVKQSMEKLRRPEPGGILRDR